MAYSDRQQDSVCQVVHIVQGDVVRPSVDAVPTGDARWVAPALDLDALVWPKSRPVPAWDVPTREVVDLLDAVAGRLRDDTGGFLAAALEGLTTVGPVSYDLAERAYAGLWQAFAADALWFQIQCELGGPEVLDGWKEFEKPRGGSGFVRACPARLVHIMAGNGPGVASMSVVRGALTRSVNLLKLPANDLFTAPALLQHLIATTSSHPITRSFSAVHWPGGDEMVERRLLSPLWFDKIVAWGGERAIRSAARWLGPGLELVAFDPKSSISVIGAEAFGSDESLAAAADLAATDATVYDQDACTASRFQYVEGSVDQVDRYCGTLVERLGVAREKSSANGPPVPTDIREEIEFLACLEPEYRVWGGYDGSGLVIRSPEPVSFYPSGKVVNVVPVDSFKAAVGYITMATQTVGVYPPGRRDEARDLYCAAGADRICSLGAAGELAAGLPHDGFFPLSRFVRWARDD